MTQPTNLTYSRKWLYSLGFGAVVLVVAAFAPTQFLGRVAQLALICVGTFAIYRGAALAMMPGGFRRVPESVGRWSYRVLFVVAFFEFVIAVYSPFVIGRLALHALGTALLFYAVQYREKCFEQAGG